MSGSMRRAALVVIILAGLLGALVVVGTPELRSPRYWLFKASHEGYVHVVKVLLTLGLEPNAASLAEAAWEGHDDVVDALLAAGADANGVGHSPEGDLSPLIAAAWRGRVSIFWTLLEAGANPRLRVDGKTPLGAAIIGRQPTLVKLLLGRDVDPNEPQWLGKSASVQSNPLGMAATHGDHESVEALLAAGADPDITSGSGETALMVAAGTDSSVVVKVLLNAKANPALQDGHHHTALDYAVSSGNEEVIALLVPSYVPDKGVTVSRSNGASNDVGIIRAECGRGADGLCRMACKADYADCMQMTNYSPSCLQRFCNCTAPCPLELCRADEATLRCGRDWLTTANGAGHGMFKSARFDGQFYISQGRFVMSGHYKEKPIRCDVTEGMADLWECLGHP
jgi:ankyrin repeat protein